MLSVKTNLQLNELPIPLYAFAFYAFVLKLMRLFFGQQAIDIGLAGC